MTDERGRFCLHCVHFGHREAFVAYCTKGECHSNLWNVMHLYEGCQKFVRKPEEKEEPIN